MKKEAIQTAVWLWGIARNPDLVWIDQETKEETHEHCSRRFRFNVLRPIWMYSFLATKPGCGCIKRFGLWHTIWCWEHVSEKADEKNGDQ